MPQPVAYLRRSRVDTRRPGAMSHAQQLEAIKGLASRHGDPEPFVIEDWGRSGREEKTHLRDGFAALTAMIRAGEVSAVYAYDLSRLGRSIVTVHQLAKQCEKAGIPVRCATGHSPDVSTAEGRMVLGILGLDRRVFRRVNQGAGDRPDRDATTARRSRRRDPVRVLQHQGEAGA